MKRYDIFWASLDPAEGSEMAKTRPVVIVSLDELNAVLHTVVICPLTTTIHPAWRSRLTVRAGTRRADIAVDQIRSIAKSWLGRRLGRLSEREALALRRVITEMYGE